MGVGYLINPKALWIGIHYSSYDRRICINLIPCIIVFIVLNGGN